MKDAVTLGSPLTALKGVGEKTAALFASKGIRTVGELLEFYPRDYDYYTEKVSVCALAADELQAVRLVIVGNASTVRAGGYQITTFRAADETGSVRLVFYNMPYLARTVRAGSIHVFRGMVRRQKNGVPRIEQPSIYSPAEYEALAGTFQPRYHLTKGLKNAQAARLVHRALDACSLPSDYIPPSDLSALGLMDEHLAVRKIHFPSSEEELAGARDRKVFDEFFAFVYGIRRKKTAEEKNTNLRPMLPVADTERLIEQLPYRLTASQTAAWREIREDLCGGRVMNRLLQGDVGSGKTILAFLSLLLCAANGRQGALMAPTEVLAQQHMRDLTELVSRYQLPIRPVLLTGNVTGKERQKVYAAVEGGSVNVIIGTHALIQEKLIYHDIGLVITDEQHRFGVRQRETLAGKGDRGPYAGSDGASSAQGPAAGTESPSAAQTVVTGQTPVLVMSATPIPRTLSLILYGDLQVSRLTELPANRLPIRNLAAPSSDRGKMYAFILKQIGQGRQAYVICPSVEESEDPGLQHLQNVTEYTQNLRKTLPASVRIESLNGRMKPAEKSRIMTAFERHDIDILVSTTVIEVGINVPNATCMLIENAERFGLSQLHQLRGRVGRGQWQSYCMFLYSDTLREKPERLAILETTNDGFQIAEEDLKLRGPGDLFGTRQSGQMGFRLADIYEDAALLAKASDYVDTVLSRGGLDPEAAAWIRTVDLRSI